MIVQAPAYGREAKILLQDTDKAVAVWKDAAAKSLFSSLTEEIEERIMHETPHLEPVSS
jgi:hypothetical protein